MGEGMPSLSDFLLAFELFRDPILCAMVAGAVLGYLSVFIVLWRMVFVTAALSQLSGLGVALSIYLGIHLGLELDPVMGASVVGLLAAGVFARQPERLFMSRESLLAIAWLAAGAGTFMLGDRISQEAHSVSGILFGTAVLVDPIDLFLVVSVGAIVLVLTVWSRRGLVFVGFDPDAARVQKLPVELLEHTFLVLVTSMVAVSTRALGALPVFAFSVLPGLAALMIAPRFRWAFPIALVLGSLSGLLGYMVAFFLSFPVGASQTAVAVGFVALAVPVRLLRPTG